MITTMERVCIEEQIKEKTKRFSGTRQDIRGDFFREIVGTFRPKILKEKHGVSVTVCPIHCMPPNETYAVYLLGSGTDYNNPKDFKYYGCFATYEGALEKMVDVALVPEESRHLYETSPQPFFKE